MLPPGPSHCSLQLDQPVRTAGTDDTAETDGVTASPRISTETSSGKVTAVSSDQPNDINRRCNRLTAAIFRLISTGNAVTLNALIDPEQDCPRSRKRAPSSR